MRFPLRLRLNESGTLVRTIIVTTALVIEVVAADDLAVALDRKVLDHLDAGARLVCVVFPELRCAMVYRHNRTFTVLEEQDELNGETVLPGSAVVSPICWNSPRSLSRNLMFEDPHREPENRGAAVSAARPTTASSGSPSRSASTAASIVTTSSPARPTPGCSPRSVCSPPTRRSKSSPLSTRSPDASSAANSRFPSSSKTSTRTSNAP